MSDPFAQPPQVPAGGFSSSSSSGGSIVPCSNGKRLGAALLDVLLFVLTCGIGWLIWSVVLWSQATTPAKKMLGLRIVDAASGAPATMNQMLLRQLVGHWILDSVSGGLVSLASAVLILVNPNRQGVWDYLAKTTVVHEG